MLPKNQPQQENQDNDINETYYYILRMKIQVLNPFSQWTVGNGQIRRGYFVLVASEVRIAQETV